MTDANEPRPRTAKAGEALPIDQGGGRKALGVPADVLATLRHLDRLAFARDRATDPERRVLTLTDSEAAALITWLESELGLAPGAFRR